MGSYGNKSKRKMFLLGRPRLVGPSKIKKLQYKRRKAQLVNVEPIDLIQTVSVESAHSINCFKLMKDMVYGTTKGGLGNWQIRFTYIVVIQSKIQHWNKEIKDLGMRRRGRQ